MNYGLPYVDKRKSKQNRVQFCLLMVEHVRPKTNSQRRTLWQFNIAVLLIFRHYN